MLSYLNSFFSKVGKIDFFHGMTVRGTSFSARIVTTRNGAGMSFGREKNKIFLDST